MNSRPTPANPTIPLQDRCVRDDQPLRTRRRARVDGPLTIFGPLTALLVVLLPQVRADDELRALQQQAVDQGRSDAAHWGWQPDNYVQWGTHSNRLVPIYTFGTRNAGPEIDLESYTGEQSLYRDQAKVIRLYERLPLNTFNPHADYLDQTNVYDLQRAALEAGKKHIVLVVFDGMDWQTTRAASIYNLRRVAYYVRKGNGDPLPGL